MVPKKCPNLAPDYLYMSWTKARLSHERVRNTQLERQLPFSVGHMGILRGFRHGPPTSRILETLVLSAARKTLSLHWVGTCYRQGRTTRNKGVQSQLLGAELRITDWQAVAATPAAPRFVADTLRPSALFRRGYAAGACCRRRQAARIREPTLTVADTAAQRVSQFQCLSILYIQPSVSSS